MVNVKSRGAAGTTRGGSCFLLCTGTRNSINQARLHLKFLSARI